MLKNGNKKTAILFPGQGAQAVGMGKDFFENFKESRLVFEEASDAIHFDLKKICFDGPLDALTMTENLQPALFTTEAAIWTALKASVELQPVVMAGHSLGEYAALFACGSLSLSDGARMTRLRGAAMQRAVPAGTGTMAAVLGLENQLVEQLCVKAKSLSRETVEPANFNAPGQVVIAGTSNGVAKAEALMKSDPLLSKGKVMPLQVSAPFHCSLMEPARKEMEAPLARTSFKAPSCMVIPNVTAQPIQNESSFSGLLTDQIVRPVKWEQSMRLLKTLGVELAVEVGPGRVLAGLQKRIDREVPVFNVGTVDQLKEALK